MYLFKILMIILPIAFFANNSYATEANAIISPKVLENLLKEIEEKEKKKQEQKDIGNHTTSDETMPPIKLPDPVRHETADKGSQEENSEANSQGQSEDSKLNTIDAAKGKLKETPSIETKEGKVTRREMSGPQGLEQAINKKFAAVDTEPVIDKTLFFDKDRHNMLLSELLLLNDKSASSKPSLHRPITKEQKKPKSSPSFYLRSVIYKTNNEWTIWVNETKISSDDSDKENLGKILPGLDIISVDQDKVRFKFATRNLIEVSPFLERNLVKLENGAFSSEKYDINIDSAAENVYFTLRPNQSMSLYSMEIIEGYVPEIEIR